MAEGEFKPNIYPVMYWALAYGATAGLVLLLVRLMASFITWIWFPVFLAGLAWGGWRNYQKQKAAWVQNSGIAPAPQTAIEEIKQAVSDISEASRTMIAEEQTAPPAITEETTPPETTEAPDDETPPTP